MSDIDLTEAIKAGENAYRAAYLAGDLGAARAAAVTAAAPLIEAQVREQIAREIDHLQAGVESNDVRVALRAAARTAREGAS